jgi:tetratricopeptide (TPR) repeat protein
LAQSYLERGELRKAKAEAEKGLKLYPDDAALSRFLPGLNSQIALHSAGLASEAEQLIAARDFQGALKKLEAGLREDPGSRRLVELAAGVRGQLSQSVTPQQRKHVEQLYFRAVERYLAGQYETAGKLADEVLTADPGNEAARALKDKVDAAQRLSR